MDFDISPGRWIVAHIVRVVVDQSGASSGPTYVQSISTANQPDGVRSTAHAETSESRNAAGVGDRVHPLHN
jgi:hypothetical protein